MAIDARGALLSRGASVDNLELAFFAIIIPEAGILKNRDEFAVEIIEREVKAADRKAFTLDDELFMLEWPVLKFAATTMPENRWADVAMWVERMKVRLGQPSPAKRAPAIRQALGLASLEEARQFAQHRLRRLLEQLSDA